MGSAYVPINRQMGKEDVVHTHTEFCSTVKKNEILSFAAKWMELEDTMLSEVSQVQKDRYCTLSLVGGR
jgi:hypothetical protein